MKTTVLRASSACFFALFASLGVACESSDGGSSGSPAPSPGSSSGGPDPVPVVTCAPVTGKGVTHTGDVKGNEVWSAADSPHIVTGNVSVRNSLTLTIEPCAEVRVAKGANIQVAFPGTPNTGSLVAEGTAEQPIRIVGDGGARWASLSVHAPGTARLAHVTLEGGGGGDFQEGATLGVYGDSEDGADALVFADHVTIVKSLGTGVLLTRGASFVAGSRDLVVRESGSETNPYPLQIEEHAFDTLPTGKYTGNRIDEILVDPGGGRTAGSGLLADGTLHERGVPYHVGRSKGDSLRIGGRPDGQLVTLTIEPGVVMRFSEGAALAVQHVTNTKPSTAAIRAIGTAEKPIVFTSASSAPKAGDWQGLWFGGFPSATDKLDHVRIEYAGYDCGCILSTCSSIAEHEGAIIFTAQPPSAFVTNTVFANIAGHGITQGYDGSFVDLRPTNAFENVTGCAQTRPRESTTTCPSPRPACD